MVYELSEASLEIIDGWASEAEPLINQMVAEQWEATFANPESKAYLGQPIATGVNRALEQAGKPTLTVARLVELDPAVEKYLSERGGQYITWLTESGKADFRRLLVNSYRENGTMQGFAKVFREQYPTMQTWKANQIWITESNLATSNAQFSAYEQIEDIIGFRNILGPNPCVICQFFASYDHKMGEDRGPYHVYCQCIPEPIIQNVHRFRDAEKDPLNFMDKNVYDRLNNNYKEFHKETILHIDLPSLI